MKHLRYFLMAALVALPLTACDEDSDPVIETIDYGTVTGTVSAEGTGLSGVAITLVGPTSQSATTGAGGTYTFTNVEAGSYGVAIDAGTHADVSFSQTSKTTTISTNGETATVDFSGSYIRTATITGTVTADGAPLGGVAVTVTGGPDNVTNNSVTNAGGEYFATGLRAGTFTVTITGPAGVTFTTTSAAVTVATGETKTAHFLGDAIQMATITGAVTVDNVGQAGVAVALSNTGGAVAATESGPGGAFSFMNVTPGTYTVTITAPADTEFDVLAKDVTVGEGDAGVVNFAGKGPEEPATLSIQSIMKGGAPIVLTNVTGQVEVTLNITRGDRDLDHVDVLIDDEVVATQTFAVPVSPAEAIGEKEIITLNVPTTQVRMVGDFYVPVVFNGGAFFSANLYEVGATAPIPSNEVPVVMNNIDALFLGTPSLTADTPDPSYVDGVPLTWYTGNATFVGPQYLAYSTAVPMAVNWPDVGTAGCAVSGSLAGSATAGLLITNNYNCSGKEGSVIPDATAAPVFDPAVVPAGPDGSTVTYPASGFSKLGAEFMLDSEQRWFVIPPAFLASNPLKVNVDNKAPTVEVHGQANSVLGVGAFFVAFNDLFDQQWVNATYPFSQDIAAIDGGSGVDATTRTAWKWNGDTSGTYPAGYCTGSSEVIVLGRDLDESVASDGTPDGYKLCATAADNLGNLGFSLASNWFGVDTIAPTGRLHETGSPLPAPGIAGTLPAVSTIANTTIYNIAAPAPGTDTWGIEGIDSRSGFEATNAVPADIAPTYQMGYPVDQRLTHTDVNGVTEEAGVSDMPIVLTDTWVRTSAELPLLGNTLPADPGYYAYKAVLTDRAGNSTTVVDRNWLVDQTPITGVPSIAFLSWDQTFYAPGADANFVIFGADDLEVIDATVTMDYPSILGVNLGIQHTQSVGMRWDGLDPFDPLAFTTAIAGVKFVVPSVLGRYDFTCDGGAGSPYTACAAVANTITADVDDFNVDLAGTYGDARDLLPVSATPTMFEDAGGNLSAPGAPVPFNVLQWSDTTRAPWLDDRDNDLNQDLITWRIFTNGTSYFAEHMAPTSIEEPFFDATALVLNDGATILTCGLYPAPVLTDNGVNRFWTYALPIPGVTTLCGAAKVANPAATYHAVGILDNAALISQGI